MGLLFRDQKLRNYGGLLLFFPSEIVAFFSLYVPKAVSSLLSLCYCVLLVPLVSLLTLLYVRYYFVEHQLVSSYLCV